MVVDVRSGCAVLTLVQRHRDARRRKWSRIPMTVNVLRGGRLGARSRRRKPAVTSCACRD